MTQVRITLLIVIALAVAGLIGCNNRTPVGEDDGADWARQIKLPKAEFTPDPELTIVTWRDYLPQEVLDLFTRTYGTRIVPTLIKNNEEMFDLLEKDPDRYDLLTPSDYMVTRMIKGGLLHRLGQQNLPNLANLDEDVRRLEYDRGLRYCVPLFRTSLGIAFNIKYIGGIPRNWEFLVQQVRNDYLAYRAGITKEMRFAMGIALMLHGYSPNTTNPAEIIEARDLLVDAVQRYGFVLMGDANDDEGLISNDILLGVNWNGTAAAALHQNPDIRFLLPEGQVLVTIDNAVISARSKRTRTAELFANYLLIPQVAAKMTNYNYFSNSITASLPFVKRVIRNGPGFLFPEEENRLFLQDLGPSVKLYEEAWAMVLQTKIPDTLVKLPLPKGGFFKGDTQTADFTKGFSQELKTKKSESQ